MIQLWLIIVQEQDAPEAGLEAKSESDAPVPEVHEESRKPRVGRRAGLPTKADIDDHFPVYVTSIPLCGHCVAGQARLVPHRVQPSDRERLGVTVSADHAFLVAEEFEEGMQPTFVIYDDDDRMSLWAIGVQGKAATEPVAQYFVSILDQSGHQGGKLTVTSDQVSQQGGGGVCARGKESSH